MVVGVLQQLPCFSCLSRPAFLPPRLPSSPLLSLLRIKKPGVISMSVSVTKSAEIAAGTLSPMASEQEIDLHSELLEAFYTIPGIDKAWMCSSQTGNNREVVVAMSQINLLANSKRKYMSYVHIPEGVVDGTECNWSPFPFELTGVSLLVPSLSGGRLLVIRNGESSCKDGSSPVKLEVWSSAQLLKEIIVPTSVHGSVYADGWFEGVSWSQDESYVAYVAEEPAPNRPVFGKSWKSDERAGETDPRTWKGQGDWQEDWGESYTGKRRPILFVADIKNGIVQKVEGIPNDLNAGQVVWAPPSQDKPRVLVFVGWPSDSGNFRTPRKLGIKYCYNRPCALYAIEAPQAVRTPDSSPSVQQLTKSISSAFLPRFSPDGDLLIFLSAKTAVDSGAHCATNSLHSLKWPITELSGSTLEVKDVVSVVMQPAGGFPGLYCLNLLAFPWLTDKKTILLSSAWFSMQTILAINVESGKVSRVTPTDDISSWSLLSVHDDYIVAARSNPGQPQSLKIGICSSTTGTNGVSRTWNWLDIHNPTLQYPDKVKAALSSIKHDVLQIPIPKIQMEKQSTEGAKHPFEAIFISSKVSNTSGEVYEKPPLVVFVHGGPHSVYTASFSRITSFLAALGLNLLLVNYRGSTGFGEEALQSLPGNAGHQDVADVLAALDFAIAEGLADPRKVAVLGGSHGGFLATHLIGQAPDRFVTAAVINPVCNISSMVGVSDIPDWCYVESFGKEGVDAYSEAPSINDLSMFHQASPIAHISKVKVPTLFLLGAQDRRVPISNGFQYVQALRSRGLKVKVIVFPDDAHPIDRPQSEFEMLLNIGVWLKRFLEPESRSPL